MKIKEIAEQLANLTVLEAHKLAKIMKETYDIEPTGPEIVVETVEEIVEEKELYFDAILTSFGDKKLQIVRELKDITGKGLKDSKELVDNIPSSIKNCIAFTNSSSDVNPSTQ